MACHLVFHVQYFHIRIYMRVLYKLNGSAEFLNYDFLEMRDVDVRLPDAGFPQ